MSWERRVTEWSRDEEVEEQSQEAGRVACGYSTANSSVLIHRIVGIPGSAPQGMRCLEGLSQEGLWVVEFRGMSFKTRLV